MVSDACLGLEAAQAKASEVAGKLMALHLAKIAQWLEETVDETLVYYALPDEHWRQLLTNNPLERFLREIRRRPRVVDTFSDGESALNLAVASFRHIPGTKWSPKRYMNMQLPREKGVIAWPGTADSPKHKVRKILSTTAANLLVLLGEPNELTSS